MPTARETCAVGAQRGAAPWLAPRPEAAPIPDEARPALRDALGPLWAVRYRLRLRPRTPLALPLFGRGAILRGGFGHAFRRLVCHDLALVCRACPLQPSCPYPDVFESSPPPGSERLRTFSDIPRPFAFDPPDDGRTLYRVGDELVFGLTVVGRANVHLPYFVAAFRNLADTGLGPRRARFDLEAVEALAADGTAHRVYTRGCAGLGVAAPVVRAADLEQPGDAARSSLTLSFATPTEIKERETALPRPTLGPLLRRLRDRAAALAAFFGDAPLELDFKGLGAAADAVRLVEDRTRRVEVRRQSSRSGARHDIGGFIGTARYEGAALGALMPLLRLGELIHVGKHAAFGNGRMEIAA